MMAPFSADADAIEKIGLLLFVVVVVGVHGKLFTRDLHTQALSQMFWLR